jgi:hypothetical protein
MPRPTADPPEDFATLASACQSVVNDGDKVAVLARADQVAVLTEKVGSCCESARAESQRANRLLSRPPRGFA